jgi:hypothetical protein
MNPRFSVLFAAMAACAGCASTETPQEAVARIGANAIARDALVTQQSVVKASLPSKTPVDYHARIAPEHWGPAIRALKPEYVYFDGVNIVVVLKTTDEGESGLYIVPMISSVGFSAADPKIWSGTLIENSIYAVTRKGKHAKGVQTFP